MLFVGIDWGETYHDGCLMAEGGQVLARLHISDSLEGLEQLHSLLAAHAEDPGQVVIGSETSHGLVMGALVAAGYRVFALNPQSVAQYRLRHHLARAKSDQSDAKMLADLVRTDRHNHRPVPADSTQAQALKVLARSHQRLIWLRQRQLNQLRQLLRDFYRAAVVAFGNDLSSRDALAVLAVAPTPAQGRALTVEQLVDILRQAGRQRRLQPTAEAIASAMATPHLEAPVIVAEAYGAAVTAAVAIIGNLNQQIAQLEAELGRHFEAHPDAEIIVSLPGLGPTLGARVLAECGDDPTRFADSTARKNYAGCAPITRSSGQSRGVHMRFPRNSRLVDAGFRWAFCALSCSPGARRYYDAYRRRRHSHAQALRALANRLFGILHGCLAHRTRYSEDIAWPRPQSVAA